MEKKNQYETNYRPITVHTIDGTTMNGKVNIAPDERVSDIFTRQDKPFIIMVDVMLKDSIGKIRFINKNHIVWVEPEE